MLLFRSEILKKYVLLQKDEFEKARSINLLIFSLEAIREKKSGCIKSAAQILLTNMEKRFPVTKLMIAASIVDASVQHIEAVDDWLNKHDTSRAQVLRDIAAELNIVLDANSDSNEEQQRLHTGSMCRQGNSVRLTLLGKHTSLNRTNTIENELSNFINIREEVPDILLFWKHQASNYPRLAKIANVILATSAKSESCFSSAGALLSSRRAAIEPLRAEKYFLYTKIITFVQMIYNFE